MPKFNRASTRSTSRRSRGNGAVETFHRQGPGVVRTFLGFLVRMRAEIIVLAVLGIGWHETRTHMSMGMSYVLLNGIPAVILLWPASRRFVIRRVWCVLSRHRMRACVVQIRSMMNFSGWLPWMIWSRPTPVGERVWLWMRPGICIEDLNDRTEHIAVSCWARDARVRRARRVAALVIVDVIRRDPLTGRKSAIESPLTLVGADGPTPPPVVVSAGARKQHLRPFPTDEQNGPETVPPTLVNPVESEPVKRPRKTTTTSSKPADGPVLRNSPGEDLSDYV